MPPCAVSLGPASPSVNEAADWVDKKSYAFLLLLLPERRDPARTPALKRESPSLCLM